MGGVWYPEVLMDEGQEQAREIAVGELYRREDGRVVSVLEVIGNAIQCRIEGATLLDGHPTFWIRRKDFLERMDGPIP